MTERDNSGALFVNENRQNDRQPTHRGEAVVDGQQYCIAGWTRESKNGRHYLSLSFERQVARIESDGSLTIEMEDTLARTRGMLAAKPVEPDVPIDTEGLPDAMDPLAQRFGDAPPF